MIELIVVIILVGILGAVGASRFFDNSAFQNRAYADQVKTALRYAQKLAIARNGVIFVRVTANSIALCSSAACGTADLITAPGGSNSGSAATRANCQQGGAFVARWMCEGSPASVATAGLGGNIYFDGLGRPYNAADALGTSTFPTTIVSFTSATQKSQITIWRETGYVQ
jgi:MSHA pilin protein MshC